MKRILLATLFIISGFISFNSFAASNDIFSLKQFGMTFAQLKQAATQGDPDAQYALGYMYYYGKDMPRDELSARMWIAKAAAQGQPQAIRAQALLGDTKNSMEGTNNVHPSIAAQQKQLQVNPQGASSVLGTQSAQVPSVKELASQTSAVNVSDTGTTPPVAAADNTKATTVAQAAAANESKESAGVPPDDLADNDTTQHDGTNNVAVADTSAAAPGSAANGTTVASTPTSIAPTTTISTIANGSLSKKVLSGNVTREKLLEAPEHFYTLQIVGSHNKKEIMDLINHNRLQTKTTYYQSTYDGKPWYVLLYGLYPTHKQALLALDKLPSGVNKYNPLVRSIASVKISMNRIKGNY